MKTTHRHRPRRDCTGLVTLRAFTGPIPGARRNPRAHGNVTVIDHCTCGATRESNRNLGEIERGPWVLK